MSSLPTGTVTFLFTDIEGSTRLLQSLGDRYADALAQHRQIVRAAVQEHDGQEIDTQGDACFAVFSRAKDGLLAALAAQRAIQAVPWANDVAVRVRMGLHTGEAHLVDVGYVGIDVHRAARIGAAAHGGQILISDTLHALVAKDLPEGISLRDLGQHRLKDLVHPHRLFQVVTADLPADFPPVRSIDVFPNNLPRQLTSFVGREKEIAEVRGLLSAAALLTLTGTGGAGKTRLALQVAADLLDRYPDGVWLVELAALSNPSHVPKAVASVLGVPEQPGRGLTETLADFLQLKSMLVVLDNCEHLVSACVHLTNVLLRTSPNLRILATSREALGVTGETTWRIPSLSVPDQQRLPPLDDLKEYESVRLFIERAVACEPRFAVTSGNAPAIAQVCRRLDGIPLAIELAAARVKVLAVEQIAARLDDRFQLLTGGGRTLLPQHQTLRAAMDWSYDLLAEQERTVLCRFSVFAGGCTLEAAEAVCAGGSAEASDILDLLARLVDKSLVVADTHRGAARYRLLETVRQYARDRLEKSGEATDALMRHREWYLSFAEQRQPGVPVEREERTEWLERLETEHDNLRAALESSLSMGDAEVGLRLAVAARDLWWGGHFNEGRRWLEQTLAASHSAPPVLRASALDILGDITREQGEYRRAAELHEESLRLYRNQGDEQGVAKVLLSLGRLAWRRDDHERATALFEESLALSRKLGSQASIAQALNALGNVAHAQGNYPRAAALHMESLGLYRALNAKSGIAIVLDSLANAEARQGHYERAAALLAESLALFRRVGPRRGVAVALLSLGTVEHSLGHDAGAKACLEESLTLRRELGDRRGAASVLAKLGAVAQSLGRYERAARLFGAAEAIREAIGAPLAVPSRADHARGLAVARTALGDAAFEAIMTEGRAMTLEQAIEYALANDPD